MNRTPSTTEQAQPEPVAAAPEAPPRPLPFVLSGLAIASVVGVSYFAFPDPTLFRAAVIAGACLILWLSETVPLYATTLLLWVAVVALLGPLNPEAFSVSRVLATAANPVMALFFGG